MHTVRGRVEPALGITGQPSSGLGFKKLMQWFFLISSTFPPPSEITSSGPC